MNMQPGLDTRARRERYPAPGALPEVEPQPGKGEVLWRSLAAATGDIIVFGGGIIPDDDIATLKKQGVAQIFTPGTPLQDIVGWLRKRFPEGVAL